jgi:hypothetical protein
MKKFSYTFHNVVGHPLMEIAHLLGFPSLANWFHEVTLPRDWEEEFNNSFDAGEQ